LARRRDQAFARRNAFATLAVKLTAEGPRRAFFVVATLFALI
jgi:hypothetical protein